MYRSICILLCCCILAGSCRKPIENRRTVITGRATHAGKNYPEVGINVVAVAYYTGGSGFAGPLYVTKVLDSVRSDVDGTYSMQFSTDINGIDSIMVYGDALSSTWVRIKPGIVNQDIGIEVSNQGAVVQNNIHVVNNSRPPLVLFYTGKDSLVITVATFDTVLYNVDSALYLYPYSEYKIPHGRFDVVYNGYFYESGIQKKQSYDFLNLRYVDTISVNATIDATTFQ